MSGPRSSLLRRALAVALVAGSALAGGAAHPAMWCAWPLWVHEWGVHVFGAGGLPAAAGPWPAFFHSTVGGASTAGAPVRDLPVDGGDRALPVLHFYSARQVGAEPIPVGLEVGFAAGAASSWFPQIDLFRSAAQANGAGARAARDELLKARAARPAAMWGKGPTPLPPDPTRQLVWNRLSLNDAAPRPPSAADAPWIAAARAIPALWVSGAGETDRFVFYEGQTAERVPLELRRAAGWAPGHRAYSLVNGATHAVHDVFVTSRDGGRTFVVSAASIAPHASLDFVLDDHAVPAAELGAATRDALRAALVEAAPPANAGWGAGPDGECHMGRDPAIPVEKADGHRLYPPEVDLVLQVWGARFFDQPGTTIVYREDEATLDEAMPLSLYTDMYNYVVLHRAGLALWESVALP